MRAIKCRRHTYSVTPSDRRATPERRRGAPRGIANDRGATRDRIRMLRRRRARDARAREDVERWRAGANCADEAGDAARDRARRGRTARLGGRNGRRSTFARASVALMAFVAVASTAFVAVEASLRATSLRVTLSQYTHLNLREIEVLDSSGRNLALGKTINHANGCSDYHGLPRSKVVDGDVNSWAATNYCGGAWWHLILMGDNSDVSFDQVIVRNMRGSYFGPRLVGGHLDFFNSAGNVVYRYDFRVQQDDYWMDFRTTTPFMLPLKSNELVQAPNGYSWMYGGSSQAVAVGDRFAVVGAPAFDNNCGRAFVYVRTPGGGWNYHQTLYKSGSETCTGWHDRFGYSVAMFGNFLWIGAPQTSAVGQVYMYTLQSNDQWSFVQSAANGGNGGQFGISISINGEYGLVGSSVNAIYIYRWNGGSWDYRGPYTSTHPGFGTNVAISQDQGEAALWHWFATNTGRNDGQMWFYNLFCNHPTCWGIYMVGGARGTGPIAMYREFALVQDSRYSCVFAYKRQCARNCNWQTSRAYAEQEALRGFEWSNGFGSSISITETGGDLRALIGSPNENGGRGRVYVFKMIGMDGLWRPDGVIEPKGNHPNKFGASVSVGKSSVLVGALGRGFGTAETDSNGGAWLMPYSLLHQNSPTTVAVGDSATRIGQYAHDFSIKVKHPMCDDPNDCFKLYNGDGVGIYHRHWRLRCEVFVEQKDVACSTHGAYLPCMNWGNFYPSLLPLARQNGKLVPGHYRIRYKCYWTDTLGAHLTYTNIQGVLHEFEILRGCDAVLSAGDDTSPFAHIVNHFFLSSDEFNSANCDENTLYDLKESIFRRYDIYPRDGSLSLEELTRAFSKQGQDSYSLRLWDSIKGGLLIPMSHFMKSTVVPLRCRKGQTNEPLQFVPGTVVYPTNAPGMVTSKKRCLADTNEMKASWEYNMQPVAGDFVCVYIDGILFEKLDSKPLGTQTSTSDYVTTGNVLSATSTSDIRPFSGGFTDAHMSLIASFNFDTDFNRREFISTAPLVSGQSQIPKLVPRFDATRQTELCTNGHGALCLKPFNDLSVLAPYSYKGDDLPDDFAMSFWVHGRCGSQYSQYSTRTSLVELKGVQNTYEHKLSLTLSTPDGNSQMTLKIEYNKYQSSNFGGGQAASTRKSMELNGKLACNKWHLVGFAVNAIDGMTLFANPSSLSQSTSSSNFANDPSWPTAVNRLLTSDMVFFQAIHVEFDDVRLYTGSVTKATFVDTFRCGHFAYCSTRAHATPSSRRTVCVQGRFESRSESVVCAEAMYYDGAAIDLSADLITAGVSFSFRDTSSDELSFEILRRPSSDRGSTQAFEVAILVEGSLSGCAAVFNSMTYLDRDAGTEPYAVWNYAVRTKESSSDRVSATLVFKAPWTGTVEGNVIVHNSETGVPFVRICADFGDTNHSLDDYAADLSTNIALNRRVMHSSAESSSVSSYVVTDGAHGQGTGFSTIGMDEYLRVDLAGWSVIENIQVCGRNVSPASVTVHVQDFDPKDTGDHGAQCFSNAATSNDDVCVVFACRGTIVPAYRGQFVTVVAMQASVHVSEIRAFGFETRCKFSAVTDIDGTYAITLMDTSGRLTKTSNVLVGAYKEEVQDPDDEPIIDSNTEVTSVLLVVTPGDVSVPGTIAISISGMESTMNRDQLRSHIELSSGFGARAKVLISDSVWSALDEDSDGSVEAAIFQDVATAPKIRAMILYPVIDTETLSDFEVVFNAANAGSRCQDMFFYHADSMAVSWEDGYHYLTNAIDAMFSSEAPDCTGRTGSSHAPRYVNEPRRYAFPIVGFGFAPSGTPSADETPYRAISGASTFHLSATRRYSDIVHAFSKGDDANEGTDADVSTDKRLGDQPRHPTNSKTRPRAMESKTVKLLHLGVNAMDFEDHTSIPLRGAIMFPKRKTMGSTSCGLHGAKILVNEVGSESEPLEYDTDESGWFDAALSIGKSYTITAKLENHTICHSGSTIADATSTWRCDAKEVTAIVRFVRKTTYVFFTDVTKVDINLGLFHGECDRTYTGATFKLEPVNGCHTPVLVTDEEIRAWTPLSNYDNAPQNARRWDFAAMDYSISLWSGPLLSGVKELMQSNSYRSTYSNADCQTEPSSVVQYFRSRDTLQRIVPMKRNDEEVYDVRFKFHGYICTEIVNILKIASDDNTCYGPDEPGGIHDVHLIGTTASNVVVPMSREIRVKVYEVHKNGDQLLKCLTLPSSQDGTGSTKLSLRQTVSDPDVNECHPRRGGGASCDFEVELDDDGYVQFPTSGKNTSSTYNISSGTPNLAFNYRRSIDVQVERNDGSRALKVASSRPQISLGSKVRGGDGLSDSTFWATVPLDGLVYTVVHDPPGGNSYAELQTGVELSVSYILTNTGAVTASSFENMDFDIGWSTGTEIGLSVGSGYVNVVTSSIDFELEGSFGFSFGWSGPDVTLSTSKEVGWDMTLTLDRTIRTSEDPNIPGRQGDVILGGGVEIQYIQADVLDLVDNCLAVRKKITWKPSKPTTYSVNVHTIEHQIIPNLMSLLSSIQADEIDEASSSLPYGDSCTDNCDKKQIWKNYISLRMNAWNQVLELSAPTNLTPISQPFFQPGTSGSAFGQQFDSEGGLANQLDDDQSHSWYDSNYGPLHDVKEAWSEAFNTDATNGPAFRAYGGNYLSLPRFKEGLAKGSNNLFSFDRGAWVTGRFAAGAFFENMDDGLDSKLYSWGYTDSSSRPMAAFTGSQFNGTDIMLTFSGGGHSTEYLFTSKENLGGEDVVWEASIEQARETSFRGSTGFETSLGPEFLIGGGGGWAQHKEMGGERAFAWAKYAAMNVRYSLGDENFGDKFVIHVMSDKRFGTPVFETIGGRSKCPGELGTVFRESDIKLSIKAIKRELINPGEQALFEVSITNMSPYRESTNMGLRIVDAHAVSLQSVVKAAFIQATNESNGVQEVVAAVRKEASASIAKGVIDSLITVADDASKVQSNSAIDVALAVFDEADRLGGVGANAEFSGSQFMIGARRLSSLGEIVPIMSLPGDSLHVQRRSVVTKFALGINQGSKAVSKFIQLSLVSLCEAEVELEMYRPIIEDLYPLGDISWSQSCPRALFDTTTMNERLTTSFSKSGSSTLRVNIINPDPDNLWPGGDAHDDLVNENLAKVVIQYRPVSGGEWITAKDDSETHRADSYRKNIICGNSRIDGCAFDWNINNDFDKLLSGFKDDVYEVRVKTFCNNGDAFADTSVHEYVSDQRLRLVADTKPPLQMLNWAGWDSFAVHFSEQLNCDNQNVRVWNVDNGCPGTEVSDEDLRRFTFACPNTEGRVGWVASFPQEISGTYRVRVEGVTDIAGNAVSPPMGARNAFEFITHVRRSESTNSPPTRCDDSSLSGAPALGAAPSHAVTARKLSKSAIRTAFLACTVPVVVIFSVILLRRRRRGEEAFDNETLAKHTASGKISYGATL